MSLVQPGATSGPVDMSVALNLYLPEAYLLVQALGGQDSAADFSGRLLGAATQAEKAGSPTLQMLLSPNEQGLIMAALAQCVCSFSSGLRGRLQAKMVAQLKAVGAPESL